MPAPDAPFWWTERVGGHALEARSRRWRKGQKADLSLTRSSTIKHVVVDRDGIEHVLIRTPDEAVTLSLTGARASRGPVRLMFIVKGRRRGRSAGDLLARFEDLISAAPGSRKRSQKRIVLSNAVIALDGDMAGVSHFEIAAVIFGRPAAKRAWQGGSRWMKELIRRARKMGRHLRDGGYRELIR